MPKITAKQCVPVASRWVQTFIRTCEDKLAVAFKDGACCYYAATSLAFFELAITWPSPGKFVHRFLYKILPYTLVVNPCDNIGCTVTVNCCPAALPLVLHATFTAGCACLNGQSVALTWDSAAGKWVGTATVCGGKALTLKLACSGHNAHGFTCQFQCGGGSGHNAGVGFGTCSPLSLPFTYISDILESNCCPDATTISWTVTA